LTIEKKMDLLMENRMSRTQEVTAKLEQVQRKLELLQEQEKVAKQMDRIDAQLAALDGKVVAIATHRGPGRPKGVKVAKTGTGKRGRPKGSKNKTTAEPEATVKTKQTNRERNEKPLSNVCLEILKDKSGLKLADIVQAVHDSGYKSTTKGEFSTIVYQTLYKLMKSSEVVRDEEAMSYSLVA